MQKNYIALPIALLIVACGGGGGGGSSQAPAVSIPPTPSAPSPSQPAEPSFSELQTEFENHYEYSRHWGLETINASSAYARGATGNNVLIGITDSGLDETHAEIKGANLSPNSDLEYANYIPNTRQKRHGTMVASIAAGTLDKDRNTPMHGVGFDSDILFVAIQLAEPDENYDPIDLGETDSSGNVTNADDVAEDFSGLDGFFSSLFDFYDFYNADIVNNSYGFSGNIIDYTEAQVRNAFPSTILSMSQEGTSDYNKTIYVWAAGNAGGYDEADNSSPELLAGMSHFIEEIQGHSIAVVSIDEDGEISDFSNRCGIAKDFCIAAPGGSVTVAYPTSADDAGIYEDEKDDPFSCVQDNSCYAVAGGTSFAAPFVTGGLAAISSYFDGQLGSTEIVSRLFATANKEGVYADSTIYGQGLMDLAAATSPVGQTSSMMSYSLSGPMVSASLTSLQMTNPAFGDAFARGVSNHSVIFFDELQAPFRNSLNYLVTDYRNQVNSITGFNEMQDFSRSMLHSESEFFEVGQSNFQNISNELIAPSHLLETRADKNQYFAYYNSSNKTFFSQGINGSWALGIFKDPNLRTNSGLRSKFNNPWLNYTASGASFGSIRKINNVFDIALTISAGRNKFNSNETFLETNSSLLGLVEIQSVSYIPSLQLGVLQENDSNNGLAGSGSFMGTKNQITKFIGLSSVNEFFGGKIFGSIHWGQSSDIRSNHGMLRSINEVKSSSFGFGYIHTGIFESNDQLTISIDQPLRVESGMLNLDVPVYRTKQKEVIFNSLSFGLSPSGREINSKINYATGFKKINLDFAFGYRADPFHIKDMNDYWYTSMRASIKF
jgi:subtilisin family serine protease